MAIASQPPRDGGADPAGAAGHEDDLLRIRLDGRRLANLGHFHPRLPGEQRLAPLIGNHDLQDEQTRGGRLLLHSALHPQRVADVGRMQELEGLGGPQRAFSGQEHADQGRDERRRKHPVGDPIPETHSPREGGIQVERVEVAGQVREGPQVPLGEGVGQFRGLTNPDLIELRKAVPIIVGLVRHTSAEGSGMAPGPLGSPPIGMQNGEQRAPGQARVLWVLRSPRGRRPPAIIRVQLRGGGSRPIPRLAAKSRGARLEA